MGEAVIVLSNAGSAPEAQHIAHILVEERLAACVNVIPRIQSIFRWQGEVEDAEEWMMLIKTTRDRARVTIARLVELHSYDLPAAVILPIEGGNPGYLDWIAASVTPAGDTETRPHL